VNPLLIRALMQVFGLTSLALEWPDDLAPAVVAFLATGTFADHPQLWPGDGRITAGHLAVLAERAAAGPFELTLFDGAIDAGWSWSQRDEAMAASSGGSAETGRVSAPAAVGEARDHLGGDRFGRSTCRRLPVCSRARGA
jgi:hypothetical protein